MATTTGEQRIAVTVGDVIARIDEVTDRIRALLVPAQRPIVPTRQVVPQRRRC